MKFALIGVFLLGGCVLNQSNPYMVARSSTVHVVSDDNHGTGVVINETCVLTAAHIVKDSKVIAIITDTEESFDAEMVIENDESDVSVVCASKYLNVNPVIFAHEMPIIYDEIFTIGDPLNERRIVTTGKYEGKGISSTPVAPGNSGGGIFDMSARYIGFVDAMEGYQLMIFPHICMFVDIDVIEPILDAAKIKYKRSSS